MTVAVAVLTATAFSVSTTAGAAPRPLPPSSHHHTSALSSDGHRGPRLLSPCNEIPPTPDPYVIRKVYEIGQARGISHKLMLAMFEGGWVESHMNNLGCGQETSQGVFQIQTPMHGTPEQVKDVVWASDWFINTGRPLENSSATSGELAANVERPREDLRYRYQEAEGTALGLMDQARQPYGLIGDRYQQLGGPGGPVGHLIRAEEDARNGGRFQLFDNGIIIWHPSTGAFWVHGDILTTFWATDSEVAWGYPTMDEADAAASPAGTQGRYQYFERGVFLWSAATGTHGVHGGILDAFVAAGREAKVGYPTGDEQTLGDGWRQEFEKAVITWAPGVGGKVEWK